MKKSLIFSIIVFILVAVSALYLVLNKGHIGDINLVSTSEAEDTVMPNLTLELEKKYLSSKDKNDTCKITALIDSEIVTTGIEFESSNEEVVKINENNEAIPVSDGKAEITAEYDGVTATEKIEVTKIKFVRSNDKIEGKQYGAGKNSRTYRRRQRQYDHR